MKIFFDLVVIYIKWIIPIIIATALLTFPVFYFSAVIRLYFKKDEKTKYRNLVWKSLTKGAIVSWIYAVFWVPTFMMVVSIVLYFNNDHIPIWLYIFATTGFIGNRIIRIYIDKDKTIYNRFVNPVKINDVDITKREKTQNINQYIDIYKDDKEKNPLRNQTIPQAMYEDNEFFSDEDKEFEQRKKQSEVKNPYIGQYIDMYLDKDDKEKNTVKNQAKSQAMYADNEFFSDEDKEK